MINADGPKVAAAIITDNRKGGGGQLKNLIGQAIGSSEAEDAGKADGSGEKNALETSDNKLAVGIPPIGQRVRKHAVP